MSATPVVGNYVDGWNAVRIPTSSAQEEIFQEKRYGVVDPMSLNIRCFTLEEAFYLMHELCLMEIDGFTVHGAWKAFNVSNAMFCMMYIAYRNYRKEGWIVQSGISYGTHFALYRGSPDEFHSEFLVYISDASLTWQTIQVMHILLLMLYI